jgi:hypothetical protein
MVRHFLRKRPKRLFLNYVKRDVIPTFIVIKKHIFLSIHSLFPVGSTVNDDGGLAKINGALIKQVKQIITDSQSVSPVLYVCYLFASYLLESFNAQGI